jgi:hypothetical protein
MRRSVNYHFSQRFHVPALKAYEWCTNYDPLDPVLMHENAERRILRISESAIILTDTYHTRDGSIRKQRLVNLYPDRLSWTSTHITGPNKYSQFLYEIVAEGEKASRLEFTGLHIERASKEDSDGKGIGLLVNRLKEEDSAAWVLLAAEMERELGTR